MRPLVFPLALAATLLAACAGPHRFATPDATWKTHVGQLQYSDRKRTLVGDVVVRQRGADEFQLDFQKGGGIPLIAVREDARFARAEGLLARPGWHGVPQRPPAHLRSWISLREAFAKAPAGSDSSLAFSSEGHRFNFQFSR